MPHGSPQPTPHPQDGPQRCPQKQANRLHGPWARVATGKAKHVAVTTAAQIRGAMRMIWVLGVGRTSGAKDEREWARR
jgi:hypothetical protein